jgi:hypothetical protein
MARTNKKEQDFRMDLKQNREPHDYRNPGKDDPSRAPVRKSRGDLIREEEIIRIRQSNDLYERQSI